MKPNHNWVSGWIGWIGDWGSSGCGAAGVAMGKLFEMAEQIIMDDCEIAPLQWCGWRGGKAWPMTDSTCKKAQFNMEQLFGSGLHVGRDVNANYSM